MKYIHSFLLVFILSVSALPQSLQFKIGQMIMVGFKGTTTITDSIKFDLSRRNIGGVILYAGNIVSPQQVKDLTALIKANSATPPFIAVDQEGGRVARFSRKNGFDTTYTAYTLGYTFNSEDSTRRQASMMAGWIKQSGLNTDFAPVADVNVNPASPAIGKLERSYSNLPDRVSNHISWFASEMNAKNIITTLKHFPGHGSAKTDSHLGFTDITATWADSELTPFRYMINHGYQDFIMMGHLFNARLDSLYPASLSKNVITNLLRNQIGFQGLVITDDLFMNAISNNYGFEDAIELAVNAGVDVLLFQTNLIDTVSAAGRVIDIISRKVNQRLIAESRINEAYSRVKALKARYAITAVDELTTQTMIPEDARLEQNYPNPFNPSTTISFTLPRAGSVTLRVFDIQGRLAAELINGPQQAGSHSVVFNAGNLCSGVYFYTLHAGGRFITKKLAVLK